MDLGKLSELSEHRVCRECGAEFETIPGTKSSPEVPALQQFSDHLVVHQPRPELWAAAHNKIQSQKGST